MQRQQEIEIKLRMLKFYGGNRFWSMTGCLCWITRKFILINFFYLFLSLQIQVESRPGAQINWTSSPAVTFIRHTKFVVSGSIKYTIADVTSHRLIIDAPATTDTNDIVSVRADTNTCRTSSGERFASDNTDHIVIAPCHTESHWSARNRSLSSVIQGRHTQFSHVPFQWHEHGPKDFRRS